MPLAVKNGQLLGKNGGLCESCCTDPPITGGVLCEEPFGQVDMICAYTKDDALAEAAALEASGDIWCGNFLNNGWSKEPIQDGTSCSGDDKTGLPLCPDAGQMGCTGTNPNQNDPVYGNECDCGPAWWLEVWQIIPDAGGPVCSEHPSDPYASDPYPFATWHQGERCASFDCAAVRRNPLP